MKRHFPADAELLGLVGLSFASMAFGKSGNAAGFGSYRAREWSAPLDARRLGLRASLKLMSDEEKH